MSGPQREAAKASLATILTGLLQDFEAAQQLIINLTDWDSTEQEQRIRDDLYDYVASGRLGVQSALLLIKANQDPEANEPTGCLCPHDLMPDGALIPDGVIAIGCPVHDVEQGADHG